MCNPREDLVEYAQKRGFEIWGPTSSYNCLFSDTTPNTYMAVDAFAAVECQDLRVDRLVVSPATLKRVAAWGVITQQDPLKLWGAEVHSDTEIADDIMIVLPEVPDEIPEDADPIKIGYAIWGLKGAPSSGIDEFPETKDWNPSN